MVALLGTWAPPSQPRPRAARREYGVDEVRAAIANGELLNHYQPKVAVATGDVVGVKAQLGMTVVAEGVEDCDDWDYLRSTGCDLAQGYFIARHEWQEGGYRVLPIHEEIERDGVAV